MAFSTGSVTFEIPRVRMDVGTNAESVSQASSVVARVRNGECKITQSIYAACCGWMALSSLKWCKDD